MKIVSKLKEKATHPRGEGVTLAFLGDSVTQGCFECSVDGSGTIQTVTDQKNSYAAAVRDILNFLYPTVNVNMICAGISGDKAPRGAKRVVRDVVRHQPDLTVVCYGLNDCKRPENSVEVYVSALEQIFSALSEGGSEILFMTPNMMNTRLCDSLTDPPLIQAAEQCMALENGGVLEEHLEAAKELCRKREIPVCDCYAIWKMLARSGVDTTSLLANRINHPNREMSRLFAMELVRRMLED